MLNPIYKTFYGKHIDLSKLISIDDAYYIDKLGAGGYSVGFDMHFQLLESPMHFRRYINNSIEKKDIIAVANLQKQIDEIIQAWKNYVEHWEIQKQIHI